MNCDTTALREVIANFPMRINPYFLNLIQSPGDPIWKQAIPDLAEIHDDVCSEDPLGEDSLSPVPNLVHKYPDRVLLLVTNQCAMYCRFCTRKRKVGTEKMVITDKTLEAGYTYLMRNLYGHISGMAIPTLALDSPGGKGKVPLTPQYLIDQNERVTFKNYLGEICTYPETGDGF